MHFNCPLIAEIQRPGWGGEGTSGAVLFQIKRVPSNLLCPFVCDGLAIASFLFPPPHTHTKLQEGMLRGCWLVTESLVEKILFFNPLYFVSKHRPRSESLLLNARQTKGYLALKLKSFYRQLFYYNYFDLLLISYQRLLVLEEVRTILYTWLGELKEWFDFFSGRLLWDFTAVHGMILFLSTCI